MYQRLINYIERYSGLQLNYSEIAAIKVAFQPKTLRKRQFLLKAGEVSKYTAFITQGAMRQYCIDDKGNEKVTQLYVEEYWADDRESLTSPEPSVYNIDAWEDTEMLIITPKAIYDLAEQVPALAQMLRVMDDRHAIALHKRLNSMICGTAEERYLEFANKYPHFVQRFPQHYIASYLGITKETLSRIKRQTIR
ncbi:Crp/Fnr family transcriptional regulator [Mucilaginibacter sp. UR6-1]|uniref:Crp/Fnr family transcriptional regulator n=1 Tax=Mucilaginibacter sp. UR6-1 TaxID=1435643 RepID=UPI001E57EF30|nr:Crp/Fnr family transcriptional regulator [Mucilaginibacter sp. UR6-1]MCC8407793.1 Crp/Fnr family transcriptional regulator [Mucilaginibacter sp. UR6-1]